jgi:hypothetical protein
MPASLSLILVAAMSQHEVGGNFGGNLRAHMQEAPKDQVFLGHM